MPEDVVSGFTVIANVVSASRRTSKVVSAFSGGR
jgi:hypothetical protein